MKKIFSLIMVLCAMFATMTMASAATSLTATDAGNGLISVKSSSAMNGKIIYTIYRDSEIVNQSELSVSGKTETQIGLPVRQLPQAQYHVDIAYYEKDNGKAGDASLTVTTGVSNPTGGGNASYATGTVESIQSIKIPYAKVYANASLSGTAVAELKRLDLVQVISVSNGVAHVKYHIQSGNGKIVSKSGIEADYTSSDDLIGTGYMKDTAFEAPKTKYSSDVTQELIENAYARMGTSGVYSQAKRFIDYYLDCSAFVSWCWYQVGYDFNNGGWTTCNGIEKWAESQSKNTILWKAEEDNTSALEYIGAIKAAHEITGTISFGSDNNYGNLWDYNATSYVDVVDQSVFDKLKAGDILFYNYDKKLTYNGIDFGKWAFNEGGANQGYDHVVMVVGVRDGIPTVIECSSGSKQVKIRELPVSSAGQVRLIVRPTGCTRINPSVVINNVALGDAMKDSTFAALFNEAQKHLGKPYVMGANGPNAFDCSSFVCWVFTHSGVRNLPRTTAQGIYNQCATITRAQAKPGDIIFFQKTYNCSDRVTHVGIYIGQGMMIHAGSPIKIASIDTSYWQSKFYAFGRLGGMSSK